MSDSTASRLPITQGKLPPLAFPALVGANVMLACGPWLVRLSDTGPIAAGFWRLALALPVLLLLAARSTGGALLPGRKALAVIAFGGLFFGADLASWHVGILHTKLANAALFGNSSALILPLAGIVLTGIWPTRVQWLALGLALIGSILLMGGSYELSPANLTGDLLCVLAGILYVGYLLAVQSVRRDLPSWQVLALSTAASLPLVLACAWISGERILPGDWTPVTTLAFSSQIIGQGLMVYAIAHFSPLVVGLVLLVQPVVAALIGWIAFDERLSTTDFIGAAIIACALILVRLPSRKAAPQAGADALEGEA
jgi:drug/metabolite transporter (DMT)-like permease